MLISHPIHNSSQLNRMLDLDGAQTPLDLFKITSDPLKDWNLGVPDPTRYLSPYRLKIASIPSWKYLANFGEPRYQEPIVVAQDHRFTGRIKRCTGELLCCGVARDPSSLPPIICLLSGKIIHLRVKEQLSWRYCLYWLEEEYKVIVCGHRHDLYLTTALATMETNMLRIRALCKVTSESYETNMPYVWVVCGCGKWRKKNLYIRPRSIHVHSSQRIVEWHARSLAKELRFPWVTMKLG